MNIEQAIEKCKHGYCIRLPHWKRNVAKEMQMIGYLDKADIILKKNVLYKGLPIPEKLTEAEINSQDWMVCECDPKVWRRVT